MNRAPIPSRSRTRERFRLANSLSILLLLALILTACRDRRATPTAIPTDAAQPVPATATSAAATLPAPTARAAAPTSDQSSSPASPSTSPQGSPTARPPATAEPLAPASPLEQAAYLHRIGEYGQEQRLLNSLLADPQTAFGRQQETPAASLEQQRSAILYRLALSYLADEKPARALNALDQFRLLGEFLPADDSGASPSAQEIAHFTINSDFLRAEALAGVGRSAEAVIAYRTFLEERPQVAGIVEEIIADTWLAVGERSQAANALRQAASHAATAREKVRLFERLAGVLEGMGRWGDATAVYEQIVVAAGSEEEEPDLAAADLDQPDPDFDDILGYREWPIFLVSYLYRAGIAYAAAGDEDAAIAHWRMALTEEPASDAAYLSLVQLVNRNAQVELFLRGEIDLFAKVYIPAILAFERFIAESPDDARAGEAWLGIARAQIGLGQWTAARLSLDQVLENYPDCACLGSAWLARAQLAKAEGAPAAGRRIYRTFARERPDDPLAPQALWLSALSAIEADAHLDVSAAHHVDVPVDPFDEAVADLLRLTDAFPDSQQAAAALSVAGIGAFAHGRYAQAANNFARLRSHYPDAQPHAAAYWLGRARHAQGEVDTARALWQELAASAPETYYGVLAGLEAGAALPGQDFVPRMGAFAASVPALPGDDGSRAFAEDWLRSLEDTPQDRVSDAPDTAAGVAPSDLPQAVADDPDFGGGELLIKTGRRAEGLRLLELAYWRYRDDPASLYPLMLRFDALGANRLSISAAYHLIKLNPTGQVAGAPLFLQRIAYPRHYSFLVEREAAAVEIDPLLIYSLIFQESLFEPPARSFAGAQGLTQIIPSTGAEIAQRLNYPNYSVDLLNLPSVNVRFGAYYLRWVRDFAHNNDVAALVGYNAGPGNAYVWFGRTAPDEALFIELLPYDETRLYLQRILTHYYHYARLYAR